MPAPTTDQISQVSNKLYLNSAQVSGECFSDAWLAALNQASVEFFNGAIDLASTTALIDGYQAEKKAADELGLSAPTKDPLVARVYELYANPGA